MKGDGTWADPANTEYVFADGTDGSFTVTAGSAAPQTVSIGKPATAGTADQVAHVASLLGASGTAQTFDGSADLSVTVTPAAIGAAELFTLILRLRLPLVGAGYSKPQTVTAIPNYSIPFRGYW